MVLTPLIHLFTRPHPALQPVTGSISRMFMSFCSVSSPAPPGSCSRGLHRQRLSLRPVFSGLSTHRQCKDSVLLSLLPRQSLTERKPFGLLLSCVIRKRVVIRVGEQSGPEVCAQGNYSLHVMNTGSQPQASECTLREQEQLPEPPVSVHREQATLTSGDESHHHQ